MFKIENLKMGVNENGFHFQDSETGVIFTLVKAEHERLDIAVCMDSAKKQDCERIKEKLSKLTSKVGVKTTRFLEISKVSTYISDSEKFTFENFAGDSIGIKHETNKCLALVEVVDGIPVVQFFLINYYGCEEAVKDFFELCSPNITEIQTGPGYNNVIIKKSYSLKTIKTKIQQAFVEGIENYAKHWRAGVICEEVSSDEIMILTNYNQKIELFKESEGKYTCYFNEKDEPLEAEMLVCLIEAVKRFPQIEKLKCGKICITQKNVDTVLKYAISKAYINLTI